MARMVWRCFHCGDVFYRAQDAREHFGGTQGSLTGCQIKGHEHALLRIIREQEDELVRHRAEDTDLIRAMESMRCEHALALQREEEAGFARAVREMQSLARQQFGQEIAL